MRERFTSGPGPKPASLLLRTGRGLVLMTPAVLLAVGALRSHGRPERPAGLRRPVPGPRLRHGFHRPAGVARAGRPRRHHALRHRPELAAGRRRRPGRLVFARLPGDPAGGAADILRRAVPARFGRPDPAPRPPAGAPAGPAGRLAGRARRLPPAAGSQGAARGAARGRRPGPGTVGPRQAAGPHRRPRRPGISPELAGRTGRAGPQRRPARPGTGDPRRRRLRPGQPRRPRDHRGSGRVPLRPVARRPPGRDRGAVVEHGTPLAVDSRGRPPLPLRPCGPGRRPAAPRGPAADRRGGFRPDGLGRREGEPGRAVGPDTGRPLRPGDGGGARRQADRAADPTADRLARPGRAAVGTGPAAAPAPRIG